MKSLALLLAFAATSAAAAPQITGFNAVGTHTGGFNGEGPAAATNLQLNTPNGLWVRADGAYFYNPSQLKISEGRSVTMDLAGNMLLCESDYGYIRRMRFQHVAGN